MKIIEALKELPLIEKRMMKQCGQISQYAGLHSQEESPFGSKTDHRKELESLVQSNQDLCARYEKIKKVLSLTNATIEVTIDGVKKTIVEWIAFRDKTKEHLVTTQTNLNLNTVNQRAREIQIDAEKGFQIERMYDEKSRNEEIERLENLHDKIDGQLEVVNATTDLVEEI